jgi:hypothetical protein
MSVRVSANPFAVTWAGSYVANDSLSLFNGQDYIKFTAPFARHRGRYITDAIGTFFLLF